MDVNDDRPYARRFASATSSPATLFNLNGGCEISHLRREGRRRDRQLHRIGHRCDEFRLEVGCPAQALA